MGWDSTDGGRIPHENGLVVSVRTATTEMAVATVKPINLKLLEIIGCRVRLRGRVRKLTHGVMVICRMDLSGVGVRFYETCSSHGLGLSTHTEPNGTVDHVRVGVSHTGVPVGTDSVELELII